MGYTGVIQETLQILLLLVVTNYTYLLLGSWVNAQLKIRFMLYIFAILSALIAIGLQILATNLFLAAAAILASYSGPHYPDKFLPNLR